MAYLRLDRLVSNVCGLPRGKAAAFIRRGRVSVDGAVIRQADAKADTQKSVICLDGERLKTDDHVYIMMNKPEGVVCANEPDEKTVFDILPEKMRRKKLCCVGRLDKDTTGLLIITDDGQFVHNTANPKKGTLKRYIATLAEPLTDDAAAKLRQGVTLADGTRIEPSEVNILSNDRLTAEIAITHGRYHQIKRMAAAVGNRVESLRRISIGNIVLDEGLALGECRYMADSELKVYN